MALYPAADYTTVEETGSAGALASPALVFFGLLIALVVVAVVAAAWLKRRERTRTLAVFEKKALKVILPKVQAGAEEDKRDPKEVIGVMEPLFSSLHYFHQNDWKKKLWEGQPTFSFEICAQRGEIFFYVICPAVYADQLERQIHAQYPTAHIEPALDFDIFLEEGGEAAVGAVQLMKSRIFPIKTYEHLENDPLGALTNSLSKVGEGKAAIQILVQPTDQNWQKETEESLQNIQQGKSFHASSGSANKALSFAREVGQAAFTSQADGKQSNEAHNTTAGNVRLTAMQEQQAKLLVEKGSKVGFQVQVRVVARAAAHIEAKNEVQNMLSAFAQFQSPESNGFKVSNLDNRQLLVNYTARTFSPAQPKMLLNAEELTSLFHLPNRPLDTPNIHWLGSRKLAPPTNLPQSGLLLGVSNFRGQELPIYLNYLDRMRHLYMIGKSGSGKTNLFQNMIIQDIRQGHGVCYMDPNGDAVEWILRHIPKERAEDVILFDPSDTSRPVALNLLEYDTRFPEQKSMVINEMLSIFDKLYDMKATGGPMFEQYMRNAMLLVMDDPASGSTLMEIPKVLADENFRKLKLSKTQNQVVIDFWTKEAEKAGGEASLANMVPYITSKLTQFTTNDIMRPIIGQQKSAFNFREVMDAKKILLVTLPKGLLGEMNARLLGMIISGNIQISAFSRQNQPEEERVPFYLYVDEFQNFTSKTFATILSEARKYRLSLNITNQYIAQLDEETRDAVVGNVGTLLTWIIGAPDAEFLVKMFNPLAVEDFVNTEKFNFYIRMLIDGQISQPFNAKSLPPDPHENRQIGEAVRQLSRLKYGRDRELVEAEIRLRSKNML